MEVTAKIGNAGAHLHQPRSSAFAESVSENNRYVRPLPATPLTFQVKIDVEDLEGGIPIKKEAGDHIATNL
jgi:hypothetical protein